jgi:LuxR family maltose regulon positive regulatory protein
MGPFQSQDCKQRLWEVQLAAARQSLLTGEELGEAAAIPENRHRAYTLKARFKMAEGDPEEALDLLSEAERLLVKTATTDLRPVAAFKTQVWVAQGRLAEAMDWACNRGLSTDDDPSYLREFEHITLVKILIAQHRSQPCDDSKDRHILNALGLLQRLLKAAERAERTGSVIEILVQQAVAHEAQGDIPAGLAPLDRAMTLAEPEGYVRVFIDE